ncbi:HalOD1 output domain-containing protein [Natrinema salinisoli]|uniref:HalOD1 output domain-containing protein n=1 Tax=Natrinema salinisoli TaxID=2878535 RepID=UPI001CF04A02|nr:HalOD1 output domain-containing protein [Natrinema salinisoli]
MEGTCRITDTESADEWSEPAMKIVQKVSRAKGVDIVDLEPLYDTVDGDALDSLLRTADQDVEVTFQYAGYTVTVRGDGQISLGKQPVTSNR